MRGALSALSQTQTEECVSERRLTFRPYRRQRDIWDCERQDWAGQKKDIENEMQSIHYLCYLIRIFCLSQTVNKSRKKI